MIKQVITISIRYRVIYIVCLCLIIFVSCTPFFNTNVELTDVATAKLEDDKELGRISEQLGVNHAWIDVLKALKCTVLKEGREQKELEFDLTQIQEYSVFYGKRAEYRFLGNHIVSKRIGDVIEVEYSMNGLLKKAWIQHSVPNSFDGYEEEPVICM